MRILTAVSFTVVPKWKPSNVHQLVSVKTTPWSVLTMEYYLAMNCYKALTHATKLKSFENPMLMKEDKKYHCYVTLFT